MPFQDLCISPSLSKSQAAIDMRIVGRVWCGIIKISKAPHMQDTSSYACRGSVRNVTSKQGYEGQMTQHHADLKDPVHIRLVQNGPQWIVCTSEVTYMP